jgi:SAM-dependent methyltransferase
MYILRRKPSVLVVGIDITPRLIREAMNKREKLGVRDRCEFVLGDCTQMPFRDEVFDSLIDLNVIHHLPFIQGGVMGIHQVLKKGGYAFVAEVVTNNLLIPISRYLISRFRLSFSPGAEINFTSNQLAQFLDSIGLQIVRKGHDDYFLWILTKLAMRYPKIAKIIPKPILLLPVYIEVALQRFPVLQLSGGAIFFICQKLPTRELSKM